LKSAAPVPKTGRRRMESTPDIPTRDLPKGSPPPAGHHCRWPLGRSTAPKRDPKTDPKKNRQKCIPGGARGRLGGPTGARWWPKCLPGEPQKRPKASQSHPWDDSTWGPGKNRFRARFGDPAGPVPYAIRTRLCSRNTLGPVPTLASKSDTRSSRMPPKMTPGPLESDPGGRSGGPPKMTRFNERQSRRPGAPGAAPGGLRGSKAPKTTPKWDYSFYPF